MEKKSLRNTSEVNGHSHTYDDSESGNTSITEGHSHVYNVDETGNVIILEENGHTHDPAPEDRSFEDSGQGSDSDEKSDASEDNNYDNQKLEHKLLPFEIKQITEDDNFWYFQGYASTFGNIDRGNDIIARGAFTESLRDLTPKVFWNHDGKAPPIGKSIEAYEDDRGLMVKARMPKSDVFVSGRIMPQLQNGAIDSMSIGFNVLSDRIENRESKKVRIIDRAQLWEYSLVNIPMNPKAVITSIKSVVPYQDLEIVKNENNEVDIDLSWNAEEAIGRVRNFFGITDEANEDYRKAFLWFDKDNPEKLSEYKLPIADVIDNRLQVVPRAVFAAASAIRGARGGVNIDPDDRKDVIENINKYYEKIGIESPFAEQGSLSGTIETFRSMKDISCLLKSFGLTNKESNVLISKFKSINNSNETDEFLAGMSKSLREVCDSLK